MKHILWLVEKNLFWLGSQIHSSYSDEKSPQKTRLVLFRSLINREERGREGDPEISDLPWVFIFSTNFFISPASFFFFGLANKYIPLTLMRKASKEDDQSCLQIPSDILPCSSVHIRNNYSIVFIANYYKHLISFNPSSFTL